MANVPTIDPPKPAEPFRFHIPLMRLVSALDLVRTGADYSYTGDTKGGIWLQPLQEPWGPEATQGLDRRPWSQDELHPPSGGQVPYNSILVSSISGSALKSHQMMDSGSSKTYCMTTDGPRSLRREISCHVANTIQSRPWLANSS